MLKSVLWITLLLFSPGQVELAEAGWRPGTAMLGAGLGIDAGEAKKREGEVKRRPF